MSTIDSGLGWSCDSSYYVNDTNTVIGVDVLGNEFRKTESGGALAASINVSGGRDCWMLVSTVLEYATTDNSSYLDPIHTITYEGIIWYITAPTRGNDSQPSSFPYANPDDPIPASPFDYSAAVLAIIEAANVQKTAKQIATTNYVKTFVEGVEAETATRVNTNKTAIGTLSSLTTTAKNSTVVAINEINGKTESIEAYLGLYNDPDIIGCKHDIVNYTHTRMANAVGKNAGSDFNVFPMYGGSYRCNLSYAGVELARYGDSNYAEDGSNGHCMVFRPKFYYRRVPLRLEPLATGYGYLMREWIDYISYYLKPGFKLHPAFIGENGQEINGYYISTYEGCLYDSSEGKYIVDDAQVADFTPQTGDWMTSMAGVKPISGSSQNLTRANAETLAQTLSYYGGGGWHILTFPILSAEQMLFSTEYATFNSQTAIGRGVVDASAPVVTGGTSSLGNASGMASGTDGLVSVSYRGVENEWGNMWKFVNGINIWGDGTMGGGMPYICDDYNFAEDKKTDNYKPAGFTLANAGGYMSAFGYSEDYDWLFLPAEALGSSANPIGDSAWIPVRDGYAMFMTSAHHSDSDYAGIYSSQTAATTVKTGLISARLVYIPKK